MWREWEVKKSCHQKYFSIKSVHRLILACVWSPLERAFFGSVGGFGLWNILWVPSSVLIWAIALSLLEYYERNSIARDCNAWQLILSKRQDIKFLHHFLFFQVWANRFEIKGFLCFLNNRKWDSKFALSQGEQLGTHHNSPFASAPCPLLVNERWQRSPAALPFITMKTFDVLSRIICYQVGMPCRSIMKVRKLQKGCRPYGKGHCLGFCHGSRREPSRRKACWYGDSRALTRVHNTPGRQEYAQLKTITISMSSTFYRARTRPKTVHCTTDANNINQDIY